jgi:hypothetical protein
MLIDVEWTGKAVWWVRVVVILVIITRLSSAPITREGFGYVC